MGPQDRLTLCAEFLGRARHREGAAGGAHEPSIRMNPDMSPPGSRMSKSCSPPCKR